MKIDMSPTAALVIIWSLWFIAIAINPVAILACIPLIIVSFLIID